MDVISVNFEIPRDERTYTNMGSSPHFLQQFAQWLQNNRENIRIIDLAMFLFNNKKLYDVLIDLAERGVQVNVYSIPLDGYDKKPATIVDSKTNWSIGRFSKYDLAEKLYDHIKRHPHPNFHLYIFPHTYVRSERMIQFSRGELPYSLHIKHFAAVMENGDVISGMSSSNLAVRDESKIETAVIARLSGREIPATQDFYEGLRENSIPLQDFDPNGQYQITMRALPEKSRAMYFAPFYFDSPVLFEENLNTMVRNAHNRIIICGQHVCAYNYTFPAAYTNERSRNQTGKSGGFLANVLAKAGDGVGVQMISQTYCDKDGAHGCRAPLNKKAFKDFAEKARQAGCTYYVNDKVHSKFIIIDHHTIITTANFTPTQFIYLPNVNIQKYNYVGIHSEVGAYFVISDEGIANHLVSLFNDLVGNPATRRMIPGVRNDP